jgi:hypothetical protein
VEYVDKLIDAGLYFKTVVTDHPSTDQPVITKKRVADYLEQIGQHKLAGILIKRQGKISKN